MRIDEWADRTLLFVCGYVSENGWAPSYREISVGTGHKSLSGVRDVLARLEGLGLVRLGKGPRTICVTGEGWEHADHVAASGS